MSFWDIFYKLCTENNTKPNPVAKELGIASGTITQWKNGSVPSSASLSKIADYFGVTTDYLLGNSPVRHGGMEIQSVNDDRYIPIPAKGVGRETGARVQISQSAPNSKNPRSLATFGDLFFILQIYCFENF